MCNLLLMIMTLVSINLVHAQHLELQTAELKIKELKIKEPKVKEQIQLSKTPTQLELEKAASTKVKLYATELKAALLSAIQQGGFENAVEVCQSQAPQIAKKLSTDGWQITRTSLKARNSNNQPDAWETQMLLQLDKKYKQRGDKQSLVVSEIDESTYRYMQAIPTGSVCLACHGKSVALDLREKINQHYPHDLAVGFTLDDIRGAFSLTKTME